MNDDIFQINSMKVHKNNSFMYDDYLEFIELKLRGH